MQVIEVQMSFECSLSRHKLEITNNSDLSLKKLIKEPSLNVSSTTL